MHKEKPLRKVRHVPLFWHLLFYNVTLFLTEVHLNMPTLVSQNFFKVQSEKETVPLYKLKVLRTCKFRRMCKYIYIYTDIYTHTYIYTLYMYVCVHVCQLHPLCIKTQHKNINHFILNSFC